MLQNSCLWFGKKTDKNSKISSNLREKERENRSWFNHQDTRWCYKYSIVPRFLLSSLNFSLFFSFTNAIICDIFSVFNYGSVAILIKSSLFSVFSNLIFRSFALCFDVLSALFLQTLTLPSWPFFLLYSFQFAFIAASGRIFLSRRNPFYTLLELDSATINSNRNIILNNLIPKIKLKWKKNEKIPRYDVRIVVARKMKTHKIFIWDY